MKRTSGIIVAVCLLIISGYFCRYLLTSGNVKWLSVETQQTASREYPFTVKVILTSPENGQYLSVNLHWMDDNKRSHGYITGFKPVRIFSDKNVYEISGDVPFKDRASYIFPVIFISPDGRWDNQIASVYTDPLPLIYNNMSPHSGMELRHAHDLRDKKIYVQHPESLPIRFIIAGVWFAIAAVSFGGRSHSRTRFFIFASFISGLWEALDASMVTARTMRYIARYSGTYSERHEPQQVLTVIILFTIVSLFLYSISHIRKSEKVIRIMAITVFWGISLFRIFSLHEMDMELSKTIAGIQAGQMLRLTAAITCFAVTIIMFYKTKRRNITWGK